MIALAPLVPPGVGVGLIAALLSGVAIAPPADRPLRAETLAAAASVDRVVLEDGDWAGSLAGGSELTITGTGLAAVTGVRFGTAEAEVVDLANGAITVRVPHADDWAAGSVAVIVEHDRGSQQAGSWTYRVETAVDRQLEYAFRHWDDYNTAAFGDFNVWGGDCMNFVSQTLLARGWSFTEDWYNLAQEDWADAFVHVPSFDAWLAAHPEHGATRYTLDEGRDLAKPGDVVVFDWDGDGSLDHAQVVSSIYGEGAETRIAMVGHNRDTTYRDLDGALFEQGTHLAKAWILSIP